jgi:hypothetical protein
MSGPCSCQTHYVFTAHGTKHNAVTGIYPTHSEAEAAVKALQQSGFDMQKLSIVGKDSHTEEHVIGVLQHQ